MPLRTLNKPNTPSIADFEKLTADLNAASAQAIKQKARKEQLQAEIAELRSWFEEAGFDIEGDLQAQVDAERTAIEEQARQLLEEMNV